jgi:signal transduction histidine kinase
MELVILSLSVLAHLAISLFIYRHNPKSYTNRFFTLFAVISSIWSIFNYASLHQASPEATLKVIRWVMLFAALHSLSLFLTIHTFPSNTLKLNRTSLVIMLCVTSFVAILTQTPLVFSDIKGSGVDAQPVPGPGIAVFALTAGFFIVGSIYLLISRYLKAAGILKAQLQYLIIGVIGSAFLMFLTNFVLVVVFKINSLLVLGSTYTLIFISSTAYAIVAHQLFDIKVIIKRTVVYSGLLVFTVVAYSMIVFLFRAIFGGEDAFSLRTFSANFIAAVFIAFGFDPIRTWLIQQTDQYLFKGEYDPQAVLSELSKQLSTSLDLRQVTQSLVVTVKSQMRLSHTAVVVFKAEESQVLVKDVTQDGYPDSAILQLPPENLLLQELARTPRLIVTEDLHRLCDASPNSDSPEIQACRLLLVDLDKLKVAMVIPILVDQKSIGMFLVGDKLSGDTFTKEDVEFLTIVANQTANAIEKTRFWEEDQMKSEFVSIASHELLTPTAAIKGYLSMILDDNMGEIDDTARRFLTKVALSADRLAHLVEDLLNVSRIESGRLKINKRSYSLVESVQKAVDELQITAKDKSLDFAFVPPQELLPQVYADADHIYRVIVNLISNAIKYTNSGWIRCFVVKYSATHILFSISDSGLGIPQDSIKHLFEKFYRADRKEIAGIQGTGLGLYISKKIVDLMNGQMWVESEIGKGTTFYFTLPISSETSATTVQKAPVVSVPQPSQSTTTS